MNLKIICTQFFLGQPRLCQIQLKNEPRFCFPVLKHKQHQRKLPALDNNWRQWAFNSLYQIVHCAEIYSFVLSLQLRLPQPNPQPQQRRSLSFNLRTNQTLPSGVWLDVATVHVSALTFPSTHVQEPHVPLSLHLFGFKVLTRYTYALIYVISFRLTLLWGNKRRRYKVQILQG